MHPAARIGAIAALCGAVVALCGAAFAVWAFWSGVVGNPPPRPVALIAMVVAAGAGLIALIAAVLEYRRR